MGVYAQYLVKCAGGGWLDPGRPLMCHGVATKFRTPEQAHRVALSVGWCASDNNRTHYCPQHPSTEKDTD